MNDHQVVRFEVENPLIRDGPNRFGLLQSLSFEWGQSVRTNVYPPDEQWISREILFFPRHSHSNHLRNRPTPTHTNRIKNNLYFPKGPFCYCDDILKLTSVHPFGPFVEIRSHCQDPFQVFRLIFEPGQAVQFDFN